jgi:hypothetical protein
LRHKQYALIPLLVVLMLTVFVSSQSQIQTAKAKSADNAYFRPENATHPSSPGVPFSGSTTPPLRGQRWAVQDLNAITSNNYYTFIFKAANASLYFNYQDLSLTFSGYSLLVASSGWLPSLEYAVTPINGATFYAIYTYSLTTLYMQKVTYNYLNGVFTGYTLGAVTSIALSSQFADGGLGVAMAPDGSMWISVTELSSQYQVEVIHVTNVTGTLRASSYGKVVVTAADIPQSNIALQNGTVPFVVTWGRYQAIPAQFWNPLQATPILSLSVNNAYAATASSLTNNTAVFAVDVGGSVYQYSIVGTLPVLERTMFFDNVQDISSFTTFGGGFGVEWLNPSSLNIMYYGQNATGKLSYSNIFLLKTYTASQIVRLSNAYSGSTRINLAHPTALEFNTTATTNNYFATYADIPSIQQVSFTTTSLTTLITTQVVSVSSTTQAASTSTVTTLTNQTVPQNTSPVFTGNLVITFILLIAIPLIFGLLLGFLGLILGLAFSAFLSVFTGILPLWVGLVAAIIVIAAIFLFKDSIHGGGLLMRGSSKGEGL